MTKYTMKNVKFLKEHNLYDAHKHFMRLAEAYVPIPEELDEDEPMEDDPQGQDGMSPMDGGDMQQGGMPQGDMGQGGMPQDGQGMGQDPMQMGGNEGGMPMDGGQGQDQMGGGQEMNPMDGGDMGMPDVDVDVTEDDEDDGDTIDIDGLTKAEEKLNLKQNQIGRDLSKVDTRITNLMKALDNFQAAVDNNNKQIEDLRAEFEKRNPTETERLNLRSLDSYPFNVKPTDYWAEKSKEGVYDPYSDNSEPTTKEYVITNNDVDDIDDSVANTFFDPTDDDIQTLEKIFRL